MRHITKNIMYDNIETYDNVESENNDLVGLIETSFSYDHIKLYDRAKDFLNLKNKRFLKDYKRLYTDQEKGNHPMFIIALGM